MSEKPQLDNSKSTIDPQQTGAFNKLVDVWWDTENTLKPLHALNNLRIPWIQDSLIKRGITKPDANPNSPLQGLDILDVGCGAGILSEPLNRLGANVTGIDCNTELIKIAKRREQEQNLSNLKYLETTIEEHAVDNKNKYDVVIASETIEHVQEQELFVKGCVECLKPGGSIFITTNSKSFTSRLAFIIFGEYILRIAPIGTHRYELFIDIEDVKKFLVNENCEIVFTSGMMYNPLTRKWWMIRFHNLLHYVIHAVKLN